MGSRGEMREAGGGEGSGGRGGGARLRRRGAERAAPWGCVVCVPGEAKGNGGVVDWDGGQRGSGPRAWEGPVCSIIIWASALLCPIRLPPVRFGPFRHHAPTWSLAA